MQIKLPLWLYKVVVKSSSLPTACLKHVAPDRAEGGTSTVLWLLLILMGAGAVYRYSAVLNGEPPLSVDVQGYSSGLSSTLAETFSSSRSAAAMAARATQQQLLLVDGHGGEVVTRLHRDGKPMRRDSSEIMNMCLWLW